MLRGEAVLLDRDFPHVPDTLGCLLVICLHVLVLLCKGTEIGSSRKCDGSNADAFQEHWKLAGSFIL
jgi:hypothetical protein